MKMRNIQTKGAAKKNATKTADKKASKVVAEKVAAPKVETKTEKPVTILAPKKGAMSAFRNAAGSHYAGLQGVARGAYTMAALIVSGLANIVGDHIEATKSGNLELFGLIVGEGVAPYHRKLGRFNGESLTKEGVAWFAGRNEGNAPTYNTHLSTVASMVEVMKKGGVVNAGGRAIQVTKKVTVGIE